MSVKRPMWRRATFEPSLSTSSSLQPPSLWLFADRLVYISILCVDNIGPSQQHLSHNGKAPPACGTCIDHGVAALGFTLDTFDRSWCDGAVGEAPMWVKCVGLQPRCRSNLNLAHRNPPTFSAVPPSFPIAIRRPITRSATRRQGRFFKPSVFGRPSMARKMLDERTPNCAPMASQWRRTGVPTSLERRASGVRPASTWRSSCAVLRPCCARTALRRRSSGAPAAPELCKSGAQAAPKRRPLVDPLFLANRAQIWLNLAHPHGAPGRDPHASIQSIICPPGKDALG